MKKIPQRLKIVSAIALGSFIAPLDSAMVKIALPNISRYFDTGLGLVEWVLISYLLVISGLLLSLGRLGDIWGHKRVYNSGFILFIIGSLLCALSPSLLFLIASRALQGAGAAMLMAVAPAIITTSSPVSSRGRYLGAIAAVVYIALAAGPVLGGYLTTFFGWRAVFVLNIPLAVIGFAYSALVLPQTRGSHGERFDIRGSILFFFSISAIILAVSLGQRLGFFSIGILVTFIAGLLLMGIFFYRQKKKANPIVDLGLFSKRIFSASNAALFLNYTAQYSFLLIMPFFLQDLLGSSPYVSGLIIISFPLAVMVISPLSGILSDRIGTRWLAWAGMVITSAGIFLLSTLGSSSPYRTIILYLCVVGAGSGLFITPNNSAIMGSTDPDRRGTASAMISTMRNLGMVMGIALSGSIFTLRYNLLLEALGAQEAFESALQGAFLAAAGLALASALISAVWARDKKK